VYTESKMLSTRSAARARESAGCGVAEGGRKDVNGVADGDLSKASTMALMSVDRGSVALAQKEKEVARMSRRRKHVVQRDAGGAGIWEDENAAFLASVRSSLSRLSGVDGRVSSRVSRRVHRDNAWVRRLVCLQRRVPAFSQSVGVVLWAVVEGVVVGFDVEDERDAWRMLNVGRIGKEGGIDFCGREKQRENQKPQPKGLGKATQK
jgi:hypothetical protein